MKKNFLLKLAKMIMHFAEIETDKGALIYEGELVDGAEVFIEIEGELTPAPNGDYKYENKTIKVEDGKVIEIIEEQVEDDVVEPKAETPVDMAEPKAEVDPRMAELEAKITELDAIIAERDARIAELEALLVEKEEQLQMSVAKPAHKEVKDIIITNKENKALRFFENK